MSGEQVKRRGFHREIAFLNGLTQKLGGSDAPLPKIEISPGGTLNCTFYVWGDDDWTAKTPEERADRKRAGIEEEIAKIVDLFPGVEWEKNDPTRSQYHEAYYELKAVWDDVKIVVITSRADVCEAVVVLEHDVTSEVPDPEQVAKIPLVKVTEKKQVVEWQCNPVIAEKTDPLFRRIDPAEVTA